MNAFFPFILPFFLGFSLMQAALAPCRLRYKAFLSLTLAIPAGLAVISLIHFYGYLIHSARETVWIGSSSALFIALVLMLSKTPLENFFTNNPRSPEPAHSFWRHEAEVWPARLFVQAFVFGSFLLFIYAFADFVDFFWKNSTLNVWGGWDARFMWHLKARFLYRDPSQWKQMFAAPVSWDNQDYPLMLPGIISWGWIWLGGESPAWPALVSFSFYLALTGVLMWHFSAYCSKATAALSGFFLLTLPPLRFWAGAFYADLPLSFFCTASVVLLVAALRHSETRLFALSGFFAGCAAWTKNEGLLFLVCEAVLLGLLASRHGKRKAFTMILLYAATAAPGVAACLYLKACLAAKFSYLFAGKGSSVFGTSPLDRDRIRYLLTAFAAFKLHRSWQGLWLLPAAAAVFYPFMRAQKRCLAFSWVPAVLLIMVESGYVAVYALSPVEIRYHLSISLTRILLHTAPLAILFSFETFAIPRRNLQESSVKEAACRIP